MNEPVLDGPATFTMYTDQIACTVIDTTKRIITIQADTATLLNGPKSGTEDALVFSPGGFVGHVSGTQRYSYERNKEGRIYRVSKRIWNNKTIWKLVGHRTKSPGCYAVFGVRSHYYDYNF